MAVDGEKGDGLVTSPAGTVSEKGGIEKGKGLRDREGSIFPLLLRWLRRVCRVMGVLAGCLTLGVWSFLHYAGHHNPTSAFLLYLPVWLWSLPVLVMLVPTLLLDFLKSGMFLMAVALFYFFVLMGYRVDGACAGRSAEAAHVLRVMSYNRGQSQGTSLKPFKEATRPDVLALQDAGKRLGGYANDPAYSELSYVDGMGEFVLLSKHPIVRKDLVTLPGDGSEGGKVTVAARFELDWSSKRVVLYSVHLPTPRPMLDAERWGGFLWGLLGIPGTRWEEKRLTRQRYWDGKMALAEQLASMIQKESLPCIVVGDFNAPDLGPVYRLFAGDLQDGHKVAGSGLGFTFPGITRNPLALRQPWLRLDYIFADRDHWKVLCHVTEPGRGSQHRAVFAELELSP